MALEKSITLENGFEATNAYHKIKQVSIVFEKGVQYVSVDVYTWKDEASKITEKDILFKRGFQIPNTNMSGSVFDETLVNDSNFIKKAYEYLKTLDEFNGAIDV